MPAMAGVARPYTASRHLQERLLAAMARAAGLYAALPMVVSGQRQFILCQTLISA